MTLSPVEIRHITFARRPLGFGRSAVERTLDEVADSFEEVWRDRADLADKVEHLEGELERYRELEALLHATLVTAERTAETLKEQARREADIILSEAHAEARRVVTAAHEQHARLVGDTRRVQALLESALAAVGGVDDEPNGDGEDAHREPRPQEGENRWRGSGERAA